MKTSLWRSPQWYSVGTNSHQPQGIKPWLPYVSSKCAPWWILLSKSEYSESASTSPLSQGHNSNGRNRNVVILVVLKNRLKWLHVSHWKYPKRLLEDKTRTGQSEGWESQLRPEYHSLIAEYLEIQWSNHYTIWTGDSGHIEEQLLWIAQLILTARMREMASVIRLTCPGKFWTYCKMTYVSSPFRNSELNSFKTSGTSLLMEIRTQNAMGCLPTSAFLYRLQAGLVSSSCCSWRLKALLATKTIHKWCGHGPAALKQRPFLHLHLIHWNP